MHRNTERIDNPFLGTIFMSGEFFQRIRQDNRELVLTGAGGDSVLGGASAYLVDILRDGQLGRAFLDLPSRPERIRTARVHSLETVLPVSRRLKRRKFRRVIGNHLAGFINRGRQLSKMRCRHPADFHGSWYLPTSDTTPGNSSSAPEPLKGRGFEQLAESEELTTGSPLNDLTSLTCLANPAQGVLRRNPVQTTLRNVAYDHIGKDVSKWKIQSHGSIGASNEVTAIDNRMPLQTWTLTKEGIVLSTARTSLCRFDSKKLPLAISATSL